MIVEAIRKAGYVPGKNVYIALDVAANSFYNKENGLYKIDNTKLSKEGLLNYYKYICDKYPIISIEDPFEENDMESLAKMTELLGGRIMIVGDDFFVTNSKLLGEAVTKKAANAVLLKPNQVGTVTEMLETIRVARENHYKMIVSHRSGETNDTTIADIAVGLNIGFIKTGSLSRGERIAKYNRLMLIEDKLLGKHRLG